MTNRQLTGSVRLAKTLPMQGNDMAGRRSRRRGVRAGLMVVVGTAMLPGCISVKAPDKPIVIELNINIKQEVVYKLDKGVQEMIEQNSGIF
jgi:YnbE-like lipoprotein